MRSRIRSGSVVQDKRDKVWYFYWWEDGKRRSRVLGRFPTKTKAWSAAKPLRDEIEGKRHVDGSGAPTIGVLIARFRTERMPTRTDTKRSYDVWIRNHITPRWGGSRITDLQPRPVELGLPRLRSHQRVKRTFGGFSVTSGTLLRGAAKFHGTTGTQWSW